MLLVIGLMVGQGVFVWFWFWFWGWYPSFVVWGNNVGLLKGFYLYFRECFVFLFEFFLAYD